MKPWLSRGNHSEGSFGCGNHAEFGEAKDLEHPFFPVFADVLFASYFPLPFAAQ